MHIPDGMLDTKTWVGAWLVSGSFLGIAVRRVRSALSDSRIVLMAVLAALIFALQMLNFPVAGGTSGHFAGGAAAAIVLGPWAAVVVISAILVVQALVFADGGIAALGANMLNMAVIGPFVGWWVYRAFARLRDTRGPKVAGAFVAGWVAAVASALAVAAELSLSGRADIAIVGVAMGFWHGLIGIGEGLVTAGLVAYLLSVRPDLLGDKPREATSTRGVALVLAAAALAAAGISFIASSHPDGLEYVYERVGAPFSSQALLKSPLPDYALPNVANETVAGVLAGVVGVIVTGALLYALLAAVRQRRGLR